MIEIMDNSINMAAGVFGRCNTCLKNLFKSICALNCSPNQSDFMIAKNRTETYQNGTKGKYQIVYTNCAYFFYRQNSLQNEFRLNFTVEVVDTIDYYIGEEYVDGVINSCKNVIVPATGGYALDAACGRYDSKSCTPKRFVSLQMS